MDKIKVIETLEADEPYGFINWCTISFLTASKIEKTKFLDVIGFKIYGGYNTSEQAFLHCEKLRESNDKHDIYVTEMGKICCWDDVNKTDSVEYKNNKLNEMEKVRREHTEKARLINEQFKNERKLRNPYEEREQNIRDRIRKKLLEKGLVSKKQIETKPKFNKKNKTKYEEMMKNLQECIDSGIDYLDETICNNLKYGCITIYSPKQIHGLSDLCFKVRGLSQSRTKIEKRISKLQSLYPYDKIYFFEVGKWIPLCETDDTPYDELEKQLNFTMKCYLEFLDEQKDELEKRRTNTDNKDVQRKKAMKKVDKITPSIGTQEDEEAIRNLEEYLKDEELENKYTIDTDKLKSVEVEMK
jgi:hypothetical protein